MGKRSLVILAAGMGSRFGGIKQIEPVGPSGEILSDYAIYDALKNGFERVIFVIKKEHENIFKEKICKNYLDKIEVCFAYQELNNIPKDVKIPEKREKMWGTAHALLAAKPFIYDVFLMINSDDFYGRNSFEIAKNFFDKSQNDNEYVTINFPFYITKSDNGKVKRGVCKTKNGKVLSIVESEIETINNKIVARPLDGSQEFLIEDNQGVTVNFFGFKPSLFNYLEKDFDHFIHGNIDLKCECLIPDTIKKIIESGKINMQAELSNSIWFGMTYKEDLQFVKDKINKLIRDGVYPSNLWE